jgi:hypothetical protein
MSPDMAATSTFVGAARPHQCPLHQPGPLHTGQVATAPHAHAPARPTPCKCRQQQHSTALLPPPPDSTAEPPDAAAPPHSYQPLPMLPTHHQQFAGNIGAQEGHRSSGGGATFIRAATLRPPPPRGATRGGHAQTRGGHAHAFRMGHSVPDEEVCWI